MGIARDTLVEKSVMELGKCLIPFCLTDEDRELVKKCFRKIDATHDGHIKMAKIGMFLTTDGVPFDKLISLIYESDRSG